MLKLDLSSPRTQSEIIVTLTGSVMSLANFPMLRELYPAGVAEGAVTGFWWFVVASLLAGRKEGRSPRNTVFHWYLIASLSLLALMESVQTGAPAAFGFVIGAIAFAVTASIAAAMVEMIPGRAKTVV
jgi:hypothetical protein